MYSNSLTPPAVDQATIDHFVAKGRRERSQAFMKMIRALFTLPTAVTGRAQPRTA